MEKDKINKLDKSDLIEDEYDLIESNEKRRPKRLKVKEDKAKKSNLNLFEGLVMEIHTNNLYRVKVDNQEYLCPLSGRFKNVDFDNTRSIVVVGDYVKVDISDNPRIEEILPRKNVLKRYINTHKNRELEVILAANIDQVIITSSYRLPNLNLNLIDRYLCAAQISNVEPIICITKTDLINKNNTDEQELLDKLKYYTDSGLKLILVSSVTGEGLDNLQTILKEKITIFSGLSGTGKSTLINKLEPSVNLRTAQVSNASKKGRHTTSNSKVIEWSFGGYLIDTPGIKTFGLSKDNLNEIPKKFPGFKNRAVECKFSSCFHITEHNCNVLTDIEAGIIPLERYHSYLNILNSLSYDTSSVKKEFANQDG